MSSKTSAATAVASVKCPAALNQIRELIPLEDVNELAEDIRKHGQLVDIVRVNGEVIDGKRREAACKLVKIEPAYFDVDQAANDPGSVNLWASLNMHRGHWSDGLRAMVAAQMTTTSLGVNQHTAAAGGTTQQQAATRMGISVDSIQRAKSVLAHGDAAMIKRIASGGSLSQAMREIDVLKRAVGPAEIAKGDSMAKYDLDAFIATGEKVQLVYADPPWNYGDQNSTCDASPSLVYPVMKLDDIKSMPIKNLAHTDAVCWLWVPNCLIPDGLAVLHSWGFSYVTSAVWIKSEGPATKGAIKPLHETLLVGKRGQGVPLLETEEMKMRSYYTSERKKHSEKPAHFAEEIERLYPKVGRAELFCRTPRDGWLVFGNQANGSVPQAA